MPRLVDHTAAVQNCATVMCSLLFAVVTMSLTSRNATSGWLVAYNKNEFEPYHQDLVVSKICDHNRLHLLLQRN